MQISYTLSVGYETNNVEAGFATKFGIWVPLFCSTPRTGISPLASDEPRIRQERQATLNGI